MSIEHTIVAVMKAWVSGEQKVRYIGNCPDKAAPAISPEVEVHYKYHYHCSFHFQMILVGYLIVYM